jgi:hypothetical protein
MVVDTHAVVRRTSWYADKKPALEIHVAKSEASHLPTNGENGDFEIELKIGEHSWRAKFRWTQRYENVWLSPRIEDFDGKRYRLVDAISTLGDHKGNELVTLKIDGHRVEVVPRPSAER